MIVCFLVISLIAALLRRRLLLLFLFLMLLLRLQRGSVPCALEKRGNCSDHVASKARKPTLPTGIELAGGTLVYFFGAGFLFDMNQQKASARLFHGRWPSGHRIHKGSCPFPVVARSSPESPKLFQAPGAWNVTRGPPHVVRPKRLGLSAAQRALGVKSWVVRDLC